MSRIIRVLLSGAVFAAAACNDSTSPVDTGGGPLPSGLSLALTPFVTTGLTAPAFLTQPLDDGRVFVVEQPGRIRILRNGNMLQPQPVLDLTSRVLYGGERGLLSVAFHPQ